MRIFLEPADGWVFRGNRPFGEGGDNHSECAFPPSPSVVAGALRTTILRQHQVDLDALKRGARCLPPNLESYLGYAPGPGRDFVPGRFHIREIELGLRSEENGTQALRQCPADLVAPKEAGDRQPRDDRADSGVDLLNPVDHSVIGADSSAAHARLPWNGGLGRFEGARGVLDEDAWERYLAGSPPARRPRPLAEYFHRELRVGIGLDASARTVEKGKLYTTEVAIARDALDPAAGYCRPGLIADVSELETALELPTVVRLGGDGKLARVVPAGEASQASGSWIEPGARRFRLVLRSPLPVGEPGLAIRLESGRPALLQDGALEARILAMAGEPAEFLGGFDLVLGAPKPSVRALSEGTVFWCEVVRGSIGEFVQRFHRRSLCAEGTARWAEGFGLAVVAAWNG